MFNIKKTLINSFVITLKDAYYETFGLLKKEYGNIISWVGHLALENIANSDALYHNIEHTIMVTSVGQEILKGKHLIEGKISPDDWLNFTIALLCHDIGNVKGICKNDKNHQIASGINGELIECNTSGTDAVLYPYHIDRAKLFIHERFSGRDFINVPKICEYIEMTRFPIPEDDFYNDTRNFHGLARAADLIGQLGDPDHLRKMPALYFEFEEIGLNEKFGYQNPEDMRKKYAKFYWNEVSKYLIDAIQYLRVTQEGKQWISNLYSQVFSVEHYKCLLK